MDLGAFLDRYTEDVYHSADPEAARRYIADPCYRHEQGELVVLPLEENIDRIRSFIESAPGARFTNRVVVAGDEGLITSCFEVVIGEEILSGIEVFRVVDGLITETWNASIQPGAWG
jgi:hypothetical protein